MRKQRGQDAERLAGHVLEDGGYTILSTNYRTRLGEIDIVATLDNLLVFVEVKERTIGRYGTAEEAVDDKKIRRIMAAAEQFVDDHPHYADYLWRLDLFAVTLRRDGSILRQKHIENLIVD